MNAFQELQRVNWQNPGTLSTAARAIIGLGILVLLGVLGYFLVIKGQIEEHDGKVIKEDTLRQEFADTQRKAANLEPLKEQLTVMRAMLKQMLEQLPNKTQLADLLVDVSQEALASGIQVKLFQPQAEQVKEFYAEKPILLRMVGSYHQFGKFVTGVATLPRVVILTMHDIALTPVKEQNGALVLEGTVKTYRYLDDEEQAAQDAKATAATPNGQPKK
jgi:type IV pilus assembly protein PilO